MGVSYLSLISALTALVASIISPFVTLNTAKRQINASVISTNRTRWIETLRDQLATFVSELTAFRILLAGDANCEATVRRDPQALVDRIQQLSYTTAKIRLMLNLHEPDHVELAKTVRDVIDYLRHNNDPPSVETKVDNAIEHIVQQSQLMLKREWTRVKRGT